MKQKIIDLIEEKTYPFRKLSKICRVLLRLREFVVKIRSESNTMKKTTIRYVKTLTLLLAVSALPLSMCKAQVTVFEDFTNGDTSGNAILGSTPIVGGVWQGVSGGAIEYGVNSAGHTEATTTSMYTDGGAASLYSMFTSSLGAGQNITVSFNMLGFGAAWPTSGGFAGVSLYTGFTGSVNPDGSQNGGSENEFIGEPYNNNAIGLDSTASGFYNSGNTTVGNNILATFTYAYDTGAWTFTTTGGVNASGTGTADLAFNALQIHNGDSGDIDLNDLTVTIVPEPTTIALVGAGMGLLLVMHRRQARQA
jgi:hypothetical protein